MGRRTVRIASALATSAGILFSGCGGSSSVSSIAVTPASQSVAVASAQQYKATGTFGSSTRDITSTVTWSSSNSNAVSITSAGLATAQLPGASQITATSGSVSGSSGITVNLQQLVMSPTTPFITNGQTLQFSATGLFVGFNQDATNAVSWTSSNTGVATINSAGLASSVTTGTTTITAASGTFNASTVLTVQ